MKEENILEIRNILTELKLNFDEPADYPGPRFRIFINNNNVSSQGIYYNISKHLDVFKFQLIFHNYENHLELRNKLRLLFKNNFGLSYASSGGKHFFLIYLCSHKGVKIQNNYSQIAGVIKEEINKTQKYIIENLKKHEIENLESIPQEASF